MTYEDEEFNRVERESRQRMQAVQYALDRKAENARELGLDYEPQEKYTKGTPLLDALWGESYVAKPEQQPADKSSLFDNGVYVGSHIGKEIKHTSLDHQPWVGLTEDEIDQGLCRTNYVMQTANAWRDGVEWATNQLKEKNHG